VLPLLATMVAPNGPNVTSFVMKPALQGTLFSRFGHVEGNPFELGGAEVVQMPAETPNPRVIQQGAQLNVIQQPYVVCVTGQNLGGFVFGDPQGMPPSQTGLFRPSFDAMSGPQPSFLMTGRQNWNQPQYGQQYPVLQAGNA
jgi:hypothetical protein